MRLISYLFFGAALAAATMSAACQGPRAATGAAELASDAVSPLYYKTFGDLTQPTVVFIHGGPAWNSFDFEYSTAAALAAKGYGVVVYDQLGSGRSPAGGPADYTLKRATQDLHDLLVGLGVTHPVLMGHSFGGTIGLSFLDDYPGFAERLIFVDSPVVWSQSLRQMADECTKRYHGYLATAPNAQQMLASLATLSASMFPAGGAPVFNSADDVSTLYTIGDACGLYYPVHPTDQAKAIYQQLGAADTLALMGAHKADMTEDGSPFYGFMRDVQTPAGTGYVYLDWTARFQAHAADIYAIFGTEDGLFSDADRAQVQAWLPAGHYQAIAGASHAVYIWQQDAFIGAVEEAMQGMAGSR